MKWVKPNIEPFGGNSNSVTLDGPSDGGGSVSMHLVSPLTQGLFHKTIISSTSTMGQFPLGRSQLDLIKSKVKILGCPDYKLSEIVKCFKRKPANELAESLNKYYVFGNFSGLVWKPVIEEDFGQQRFLTDHSVNLNLEGKFHKVPILSGICAKEFANWATGISKNNTLLQLLDKQWEKYAPLIFIYERCTERSKIISKELRSFYFGDNKLDRNTVPQLVKLFGDAHSGFPINRGVKLLTQKNSFPLFYYQFSYRGSYSHAGLPESNKAEEYGPVHVCIYLFYISVQFPEFVKTDPDFAVVQKMTAMWANFARTGKPIAETCGKLDHAEWEPYNLGTQKYMDIGKVQKIKERLNSHRYDKWEKLFPLSQYKEIRDISY